MLMLVDLVTKDIVYVCKQFLVCFRQVLFVLYAENIYQDQQLKFYVN